MPVRARLFTWILRTEDPEPVIVDGFQDEEVRGGTPLTLRETVPVNPESAETVMVSEPLAPRAICTAVGEADSVKFPVELMLNVTFTE